jgi:hypothetical protein
VARRLPLPGAGEANERLGFLREAEPFGVDRRAERDVPGREYEDVTVAYRLATRLTGEPEAGRNGDDDTAG